MHELIVYFEPAKDTPLRQCLDSILSTISSSYYPSTAIKYPIHVSVTGFFTVNTQKDVAYIIDTYDHTISLENQQQQSSTHCQAPAIDLHPIIVSNSRPNDNGYSTKHLLLPIKTPDAFQHLLTQCADQINKYHDDEGNKEIQQLEQPNARRIRPKQINHISLAYWDEPKATNKETDDWLRWCNGPGIKSMEEYVIQRMKELRSSSAVAATTDWDMVLYERTHRGDGIGEKHVFQEWSRWRLRS